MQTFARLTAISSLLVLLTACASAPRVDKGVAEFKDDPRLGEPVQSACFARQIDGFSQNKDRSVVLSFGPSEDYLVTTIGSCPTLRNARRIAAAPQTSCLRENSQLIVAESLFNGQSNGLDVMNCRVGAIYRWNKDAGAAAETADSSAP